MTSDIQNPELTPNGKSLAKKSRKRTRLAAVLVLLLVVGIVAGKIALTRDLPPPDMSGLEIERPEVPSAENAYTYFCAMTNSLYYPTNSSIVSEYSAGKSVPDSELKELIHRNEEAIAEVKRGLSCRIYLPPLLTRVDDTVPYATDWLGFGKIMRLKARYERLGGDIPGAVDSTAMLLKFGALLQNDPGGLIEYLVGIADMSMGVLESYAIARDSRTSITELAELGAALDGIESLNPGLILALKGELWMEINTVDDLQRDYGEKTGVGGIEVTQWQLFLKRRGMAGYIFQPNRTKSEIVRYFKNAIENASLSYDEIELIDAEDLINIRENRLIRLLQPNPMGKIIMSILLADVESILHRKCFLESDLAAAKLLVALHAYEKERGEYPEELSGLVPQYLDVVPRDSYGGGEFRYDRSQAIVYSVGKNGVDDGGSSKPIPALKTRSWDEKWRNAEDLIYHLEISAKDMYENNCGPEEE